MPPRRYRVLVVSSHAVQYCSPLFRLMSARPDLDTLVAYCSLQGAEEGLDPEFGLRMAWDIPLLDGYRWVALPNKAARPSVGRFFGLVNPGLWKLIRQGNFDAVYVGGYYFASAWIAALAAKVTGTAIILSTDAHELRTSKKRSWIQELLKKALVRRIFKRAAVTLAGSSGTVEYLKSLGIAPERIVLGGNVVDNQWWSAAAERADRAHARAAWRISPEAKVVLFCGKLQGWKRPQDLLRAFARAKVPDSFLVFAGDGPLRTELEQEVRSLGLEERVRMLGFVNQSKLPQTYCAADLLVLPSEYERFGLVVNEAMLCGRPVIVSDRVGARFDLVREGETGFTYPCGDVDCLARVLRETLKQQEQLVKMGEFARRRMRTWSPRENVDAFAVAVAKAANGSVASGQTVQEMHDERPDRAPGSPRRMNILIYVRSFSAGAGGAQVYAAMLAGGLVSAGHSVRVVTESRIGEGCDEELPFAVVRHPSLRTLWRLVGQAHVVELTGPVLVPMLLALCRGKPIVIEHHGYQAACPNGLLFYEPTKSPCPGHFMAHRYLACLRCNADVVGWLGSLRMLLLTFPRRWLCRRVRLNAPITHHVRERLRLPRSQVIYYGVPEPFAEQAAARVSAAAPCFAYVGRLVSEKGLPLLVEAVARLKMRGRNIRLKFVGEGPERGRLEAAAEAKGLDGSVAFTGFLRGGALEEATRDITALVMPSVWEETAGLAAMEQMMRGRVVIASDIGGLGEVVGDAGLKFPVGNVEALAACLERVMDHPELPTELARKARERAEKMFRLQRMVEEHLGAYANVSCPSGPRRF